MDNPEETRFIADVMVGRLARWLRVLGLDVLYSNRYEDAEIIALAAAENRVVLTRDTGLAARLRPDQFIFIRDDNYRAQLAQVLRRFPAKTFKFFSRCLECNTSLESVDKETVFERVPPYVYLTQTTFAECPSCHRVYWRGTHAEEIFKTIREIKDED
jgi:uncharacterized protein